MHVLHLYFYQLLNQRMLQNVLEEYGLKESSSVITAFGNGLINHTWIVESGKNKFILQRINDNIFKIPADISENITAIGNYLSIHYPQYLFVLPELTNTKKEFVHIAGQGYFRLFPFVKQSHTVDVVSSPSEAYEAAKQFGCFTRLLSGFSAEKLHITLPDFHNLSLRYLQFELAIKNGNTKRINQCESIIKYLKKQRSIATTFENICTGTNFKKRVTHHDTKISNVLFNENMQGLCVIDLDTVMPGYFISDVGDMMRTYLSPVSEEEKDFGKIEIREDYFKAITDGYLSEMNDQLTSAEKKHFVYAGKFMIYMQALRFLTDFLNNDVYYGAKYAAQNFVRANNQVVLLQKLTAKENHLNTMIC